jgi:hypothetical protein
VEETKSYVKTSEIAELRIQECMEILSDFEPARPVSLKRRSEGEGPMKGDA